MNNTLVNVISITEWSVPTCTFILFIANFSAFFFSFWGGDTYFINRWLNISTLLEAPNSY